MGYSGVVKGERWCSEGGKRIQGYHGWGRSGKYKHSLLRYISLELGN